MHKAGRESGREEWTLQKSVGKLIQYAMLVILFGAAFVLPGYGIRKQAEQDVASQLVTEQITEQTAEQAEERGTIVLDPGHGGSDPGMVGVSGAEEKTLNLIYAQKLQKLLEADGYRVVLTRETDAGLYDADETHKKAQDMQRRVARIASEQPLLTVSIHQNSYPEDASVSGPQVFYYEQSAEGEKLAKQIQASLNEELAIAHPRAAKGNSTYYILKRSEGTAVIVECGFLTNVQEEQNLQQESYQDQLVQAVFHGIQAYLKTGE
jgi:N-acetylmuramoyl-L-alanine amidase